MLEDLGRIADSLEKMAKALEHDPLERIAVALEKMQDDQRYRFSRIGSAIETIACVKGISHLSGLDSLLQLVPNTIAGLKRKVEHYFFQRSHLYVEEKPTCEFCHEAYGTLHEVGCPDLGD
jgi:hypothetical protein